MRELFLVVSENPEKIIASHEKDQTGKALHSADISTSANFFSKIAQREQKIASYQVSVELK
jgi:hypothetical protein